jgi:hypothetical protein
MSNDGIQVDKSIYLRNITQKIKKINRQKTTCFSA